MTACWDLCADLIGSTRCCGLFPRPSLRCRCSHYHGAALEMSLQLELEERQFGKRARLAPPKRGSDAGLTVLRLDAMGRRRRQKEGLWPAAARQHMNTRPQESQRSISFSRLA